MRGAAAIVTIGQNTETITFAELADYLRGVESSRSPLRSCLLILFLRS